MKPILLTIKAFGAFTHQQQIDFRVFEKNHLFLIHGSTGAGKTTIFDAMCYALYGQTSGERNADSMRSERAKAEDVTLVRFVFSIGLEYYLVERKLIKVKKRSKDKQDEVEFKKEQHFGKAIYDEKKDEFDWEGAILSKVSDIDEAIEKLLGFKLGQFKQIILIPQGQFQKLLQSNVEDKKAILEKIFDAEIYTQITQKLQEKFKKQDEILKNLRDSYAQQLNFSGVEFPQQIEEKITILTQEIQHITQTIPQLEANFQEASAELQKARIQSETYQKWENARDIYQKHLEQEPQILSQEQNLKNAQKAETLKEDFRIITEKKALLHKLEKEIAQKQDIETNLKRELGEIQKKYQILEIQKDNIEDKVKEKNRLESLAPKYAQRSTWVQKVGDLQDDLYNFQNQSNTTLQNIDDREKEITATQINITNNKILAEKADSLTQKIKENKRLYELRKQIFEVEEAQRILLDELQTTKKIAQDYHQKNQQARQNLEEIEKKWLGSQASILAQNLQENEPCPVCGAIHHPKKAEMTSQNVTQQDWEDAKKQRDEVESFFQRSQENYVAVQNKMNNLKKEHDIFAQQLGENKYIDLYDLEKELRKLETDLKKAEQARKNLPHFENTLENLYKSLKLLQDTNVFQQQQKRSIELELNELNTKIRSILLELPAHLSTLEHLQKEIKKINFEIEGFDDEFAKIVKENSEKDKALIEIQSLLRNKIDEFEEVKADFEPSQQIFLEKIQKNDFVSLEYWQKMLIDKNDLEKIQKNIQDWYENKKIFALQMETLANDLANTEESPNLIIFQQKAEEAIQNFKNSSQKQIELTNEKESLEKVLENLKNLQKQIAKKEKENAPLYEIAQLAKGGNELKQDFQTHVLSAFLDEVMGYANERLRLLSDERYELRRTDEAKSGRVHRAGLDLVVFDNHTGNQRSVHNLSGGETFFTSLALALGLADVATSKAGGIQLGAMFIDEGFGTLDSHTLDRALTTLSNLDGQYRMVGIISHVAELKERIKHRIEVTKEQYGSKIAIKI